MLVVASEGAADSEKPRHDDRSDRCSREYLVQDAWSERAPDAGGLNILVWATPGRHFSWPLNRKGKHFGTKDGLLYRITRIRSNLNKMPSP